MGDSCGAIVMAGHPRRRGLGKDVDGRHEGRLSGLLTCIAARNARRSFDLVMAVVVAGIHDFGAAVKAVDGRDGALPRRGKESVATTTLNRTVVPRGRP